MTETVVQLTETVIQLKETVVQLTETLVQLAETVMQLTIIKGWQKQNKARRYLNEGLNFEATLKCQ